MTNTQWGFWRKDFMRAEGRDRKEGVFDLAERTAVFGEGVIGFAKGLALNAISKPLIVQLIRSGTSIGANYSEADEAESKRDFRHKIAICRKESRETTYWLRMIAVAIPERRDAAAEVWKEARQLHLIFCKIVNSCDGKSKGKAPN